MKTLMLGKLPFYWRMTEQASVPPNIVPDFVDFEFAFRQDYQLIVQANNAQTTKYLETVYREDYNVGYLQEGHALASSYGADFISFVKKVITKHQPRTKTIAEVGAGGCFLLAELKRGGFSVTAIDPSPITLEKGKSLDIAIINDFYPTKTSISSVDLILHYDVLEHVAEPAAFLRHHAHDINPDGLIVFAVPDCSPYIGLGDISMLLHEHLNYFDTESLSNVVKAAGFEVLDLQAGGYGGVLYCAARVAKKSVVWTKESGLAKFDQWTERVQKLRTKVEATIKEGMSAGFTLGCYVPLRALPYLSLLGITSGVRLFDDDPGVHRRYFDGFDSPVENMEDLVADPVSHLLILSFAFGERIRTRVRSRMPNNSIKITCLSDFESL